MDYSLIYIVLKTLIKLLFEVYNLKRNKWRIRNEKDKVLR